MKPRAFVVGKDADFKSCVYTVVPVIDNRLLDLPYHIKRVKQSFLLLNGDEDKFKFCNDLIAESCLKAIISNDSKDGLLTICIGLNKLLDKNDSQDSISMVADSLYYEMPSTFLSDSPRALIVDLQQHTRGTDPRIKASSWPTERRTLENNRLKQASETIMYSVPQSIVSTSIGNDDQHNRSGFSFGDDKLFLTEGLTSNFFACEDNCLITAPEGLALSGSMARIVIATARVLETMRDQRNNSSSEISRAFFDKIKHLVGSISNKNFRRMKRFWMFTHRGYCATRPVHSIQSVLGPKGDILFDSSNKCQTTTAIRDALDSVLREKEDSFLQRYIPYPLWSPPVTSSTSILDMKEMFLINSQYL